MIDSCIVSFHKEENMKKTYETPALQIVTFEVENVLKESGKNSIDTPFYPL